MLRRLSITYMASAWKPILAILLLCIASVPMPASAEQSGSIQASPSTVALQPSNPVAGGSVTINLQLYNSGNYATDVEYSFYRDSRGPRTSFSKKATVDIDTETSAPSFCGLERPYRRRTRESTLLSNTLVGSGTVKPTSGLILP